MRLSAQAIVDRAAAGLARRTSRRSFLVRSAVFGSALATSGLDYVLRPGTAYASVCGSGASCGDGWTAMCCTIHEGVNQCPPGSFAGGWWKADGASLCGGKARYYIDCQAECTHCGCGGGAFCGEHCWNCRPHCADGECDKRRVCHNVFRYGQCERDRACSGPVLCRAISCTPPWEWLSCSSASATDDATTSHSATCLAPWGPILAKYTRMGSQGSVLGASRGGERRVGRATVQDYTHGRMWHAEGVGTHWLSGPVLTKYDDLDRAAERLGLPASDLQHDGEWAFANFQHGTITQARGKSAHAVWGKVFAKYHVLKGHNGVLGWPVGDVAATVDSGHLGRFANGTVACSDSTGSHAVWGPIDVTWRRNGGAGGSLGLPVTDVYELSDGNQQADFTGGSIVYDPATGQTTVVPPSAS